MYSNDLINIKQAMIDVWDRAPYHKSYFGEPRTNKKNVSCSMLKNAFINLGFNLSKPYHEYGIGNNNEFTVTKRIQVEGGYESEVIIGYFSYVYDLYCNHVFVRFQDKDRNTVYRYADKTAYSEDE